MYPEQEFQINSQRETTLRKLKEQRRHMYPDQEALRKVTEDRIPVTNYEGKPAPASSSSSSSSTAANSDSKRQEDVALVPEPKKKTRGKQPVPKSKSKAGENRAPRDSPKRERRRRKSGSVERGDQQRRLLQDDLKAPGNAEREDVVAESLAGPLLGPGAMPINFSVGPELRRVFGRELSQWDTTLCPAKQPQWECTLRWVNETRLECVIEVQKETKDGIPLGGDVESNHARGRIDREKSDDAPWDFKVDSFLHTTENRPWQKFPRIDYRGMVNRLFISEWYRWPLSIGCLSFLTFILFVSGATGTGWFFFVVTLLLMIAFAYRRYVFQKRTLDRAQMESEADEVLNRRKAEFINPCLINIDKFNVPPSPLPPHDKSNINRSPFASTYPAKKSTNPFDGKESGAKV